jgi:hypothetical protein
MTNLKKQLDRLLTPDLFLSVYRLKYPYNKGEPPSGAVVGKSHFRPTYHQQLYEMVYRDVLMPISKMPLEFLLSVDLTEYLPNSRAPDYPEQSVGLVTLLDQTRLLTSGYDFRYTRAFFDPVSEKLARQLTSLPSNVRPDGKEAWLSRGYSVDDWLVRTLWFWAPLVHSDEFMVDDRQTLKDYLHSIRSAVEAHAGRADPFEPLEGEDDKNINAFQVIETDGPPQQSYTNPEAEATISDYAFWWIRILNSHFAITDLCGHYPYWIRWKGLEWTEEDGKFMEVTHNYRYSPKDEPVLQEVRKDYLTGVWKPMQPNPKYEKN